VVTIAYPSRYTIDTPTRASRAAVTSHLEAVGIDHHRLLVVPLLHGLAEAVVWHELVTRKPLVCARRAKPSQPEPILDGIAAVGVAVQDDNWVNHLSCVIWHIKASGTASSSSIRARGAADTGGGKQSQSVLTLKRRPVLYSRVQIT
jgi:hypothetical protein